MYLRFTLGYDKSLEILTAAPRHAKRFSICDRSRNTCQTVCRRKDVSRALTFSVDPFAWAGRRAGGVSNDRKMSRENPIYDGRTIRYYMNFLRYDPSFSLRNIKRLTSMRSLKIASFEVWGVRNERMSD